MQNVTELICLDPAPAPALGVGVRVGVRVGVGEFLLWFKEVRKPKRRSTPAQALFRGESMETRKLGSWTRSHPPAERGLI